MTRPLRLEVPDGTFHVTSRGNARQPVFLDDIDCETFLLLLRDAIRRFGWRCLTYCLMVNHYHLLLQTPHANLAPGMRDLNGGYARAFNRRHGRVGHVWQARYNSQLVQETDYVRAAIRYIVLNPVRAGSVSSPEQWPWSSHAAIIAGTTDPVVETAALLQQFAAGPAQPADEYRLFVEGDQRLGADFAAEDPIVGDDRFVRRHAPEQRPADDVRKTAWEQARPPLHELLANLPVGEFFRAARFVHRYTLAEIGAAAGVSRETVRRRLAELP
jgi:putative transposase